MEQIILDGSIRSRAELFDRIYSQLGCAGAAGRNLDALWDVLSALPDGCAVEVRGRAALAQSLGAYFARLEALLRQAQERGFVTVTERGQ